MNYLKLKKQIIQAAAKQLIPVHGEFELTSDCNCQCMMCYLERRRKGLSTEEWKQIFSEAVASGMLYALLTGGEILTRRDFLELYNFLYDFGVRITLFTNATLLNEEILHQFQKRPPEQVIITLYGANNKTYQEITKLKNGFDLVRHGLDLLETSGLNYLVRTIPLRPIYNELDELIDFVRGRNLQLGYSLYLAPKQNGQKIDDRLDPNELLDFENKIRSAFPQIPLQRSNDCSALKSAFFINCEGRMQACSLANSGKSVLESGFLATWEELSAKTVLKNPNVCKDCRLAIHCLRCPVRLDLEGSQDCCCSYFQELANLRYRRDYGKI
ncbi:MAG: radical SAM protein [Acholeplasmataceae bacterium]|jgi:MoaA/NifB/PqqE/SkfB family radical SAM enzyme|nr:radical SAM protein [Acholeplasmataceae bacterium]